MSRLGAVRQAGPVSGRPCRRVAAAILGIVVWGGLTANCRAQVGGIEIDAEGVVRAGFLRRETGALAQKRMQAFATAELPGALARRTELRQVSLRRLAEALTEAGSRDRLPTEVQYLYGLQRLDYVFVDEANNDVILAGPAEGFAPDVSGRMVGLSTGRPPLHLDDLLAALRWQASGGREQIGCSIDPMPERLQGLQDWARANSNPVTRDVAQQRFQTMAQILGRQQVSVFGVPADSHFARVLVEADYRMKRIALGKEQPGVLGLRSQLSLSTPSGNSLQRWWFVPLYDPIEVDEAGLAFHLSGQRAQLLSQDEWSDTQGRRSDAAVTQRSTQKFAQLFTEHFSDLADKSPAFAELQNVFDLAVFAALLDNQNWARRLDLPLAVLLDAAQWPLQAHPVPRSVDSEATTAPRGQVVLGMVGGVTLMPRQVLSRPYSRQHGAELSTQRQAAIAGRESAKGGWWDQ